jgi:hypothetical protein
MAKIYIDRAYIEPDDESHDNFAIEISCNGVLVGKVEMPPRKWLYTFTNEDGDLVINNSKSMESGKWDHLTKEILREGEENA